jgi:hypothetical protein
LCGLERDRGLRPTLRTRGPRLGADSGAAAHTLRFALLAMLGIVLELFVVEEKLLAGRKYKVGTAIVALQNSIDEFHWPASLEQGNSLKSAMEVSPAGPVSLYSFYLQNKGPGPRKTRRLNFSPS